MVAGRSGCDRNRLKLLLQDGLPEQRQTEVEGHLETCEDCCRQLEELAADARWWEDVRRFLRPDQVAVPPHVPPISEGRTAADAPAGGSSASEEPAFACQALRLSVAIGLTWRWSRWGWSPPLPPARESPRRSIQARRVRCCLQSSTMTSCISS